MGSDSNRGGADRTAGEDKKRGELFEMPEIRFTKLFINGSFVDAVSGTSTVPQHPLVRISASSLLLLVQPVVENGYSYLLPIQTRMETDLDL